MEESNTWQKLGQVFSLRNHGKPWMKTHAMLPSPLLKEKIIRVYFTTRDQSGISRISFADLDRSDPTRVVNVADEPLLEIGKPGTFDDSGTLGTFVMTRESQVFLYYNGYNRRVVVPWSNAIGLAVSDDGGETFRKAFDGPVIDRTPEEPYFAITPWILGEGATYRMWHTSGTGWVDTGRNVLEPLYVIKYGESEDGINWKRNNITCIQPLDAEEANARATVVKSRDGYKMWFCFRGSQDFRDGKDGYRIGYAESDDGITWRRDDSRAGIQLGRPGSWDTLMQAYPAVLEVDGKLMMFYNGNGFGAEGFGCAIRDIGA
ncbi:MAG: hypothetical protein M3R69_02215 [Acidobacteriota bacterium]|nr:hypothetical protein [Acidobacteriota bacterium]